MSTLPQQPKVLIIGAGPTGMTAALELSRMGIPLRIVDKMREPATTSRAIGVQARTLELFEQRGLVETMLDKGNRGVGGDIYGEGKRIFRLDFAHNGSRYPFMLFLSQAETEAVLRSALERQQVTIEREVEFIALSQDEHGDSLHAIVKHSDGSVEDVQPEYLIDSEGAHSISRTTLNLAFEGKTREESYVLGDLYVEGDLADSDFHIFSSEHGFLGMFPMGNRHFRLIASNPLSKPSKDTAPSLDEIQKIYDQRSHIPARFYDLLWSSWFHINSRMVEQLRKGRVFFGGDAAHIHSPAGAQGMNTGIQDMINLSWKLAYVLNGKADPKLLDTYNDDRLPVIKDVLTKTEGLTDTIGSENSLFRSVFSYVAPWIVGKDAVQENSTERMSQLSLNYRKSPLSASSYAPGGLHAGDRIPDMQVQLIGAGGSATRVPTEQSLFQLLNPNRFTLLFTQLTDPTNAEAAHEEAQATLSPWKSLLQTCSIMPGTESKAIFDKVFGADPSITLVRPDGYAAFIGAETSVDALAQYLGMWFPVREAEKEMQHA